MKKQTDQYVSALQNDREIWNKTQGTFLNTKSRQQAFLEHLLADDDSTYDYIADIACGNGILSYWLNQKYPSSKYTLADLNEHAIQEARRINPGRNFTFHVQSIYQLGSIDDHSQDLTCCWQTLSWIENPEVALNELIRITKPGGRIYISSLFNKSHEVDIQAKVQDWTRKSTQEGHFVVYNTYSMSTIRKWLETKVSYFELFNFEIDMDLPDENKGLGTYTKTLTDGRRLQFSAGMLLNWGILKIIV